jgi:chemotaxis protein methyltransferase CheR
MKLEQEEDFEQEVETLIRKIHARYGYDFSGYARASVYRRIKRFMQNRNQAGVRELEAALFQDSFFFESFLQEITVNVTEMFRDPSFFLSLRQNVLPILSTYPHLKIWDAGCSTGEELFSLAIVLQEEGLLGRTKIYATDINQKVLKQAREGIFPEPAVAAYADAYAAAGGKQAFSAYYVGSYGNCKFDASLIRNVVFYPHNLATDSSFNEFHLILCRNVLIYFTRQLQERVFRLFNESLVPLGYLGLGKKETLALSELNQTYALIDKDNRIYRKSR